MFGQKKNKKNKSTTHNAMAKITSNETKTGNALNINMIKEGTTFKGEINADESIRIDGTLIGTINSKGKIVIGKTGKVDGEINCQNADFEGEVKAKIVVTELLSLKSTTKVNGDVTTNKLAVEPGAIFTGSCKMSEDKGSNYGSKPFEAPKPADKK